MSVDARLVEGARARRERDACGPRRRAVVARRLDGELAVQVERAVGEPDAAAQLRGVVPVDEAQVVGARRAAARRGSGRRGTRTRRRSARRSALRVLAAGRLRGAGRLEGGCAERHLAGVGRARCGARPRRRAPRAAAAAPPRGAARSASRSRGPERRSRSPPSAATRALESASLEARRDGGARRASPSSVEAERERRLLRRRGSARSSRPSISSPVPSSAPRSTSVLGCPRRRGPAGSSWIRPRTARGPVSTSRPLSARLPLRPRAARAGHQRLRAPRPRRAARRGASRSAASAARARPWRRCSPSCELGALERAARAPLPPASRRSVPVSVAGIPAGLRKRAPVAELALPGVDAEGPRGRAQIFARELRAQRERAAQLRGRRARAARPRAADRGSPCRIRVPRPRHGAFRRRARRAARRPRTGRRASSSTSRELDVGLEGPARDGRSRGARGARPLARAPRRSDVDGRVGRVPRALALEVAQLEARRRLARAVVEAERGAASTTRCTAKAKPSCAALRLRLRARRGARGFGGYGRSSPTRRTPCSLRSGAQRSRPRRRASARRRRARAAGAARGAARRGAPRPRDPPRRPRGRPRRARGAAE